MARKSQKKSNKQNKLSGLLRQLPVQVGIVVMVVAIVAVIVLLTGNKGGSGLPATVSTTEGYKLVQDGAFLLDVRRQDEWDQYRAPGATLIPLDELPNRLGELPKDKEIVVICRSGNRSKQGRDILLSNGFEATSVDGGMLQWYTDKLPFEGSAPQ